MYATAQENCKSPNASLMTLWKIAGAFFRPKGITLNWKKPQCVLIAVSHLLLSTTLTWLKAFTRSNFEKPLDFAINWAVDVMNNGTMPGIDRPKSSKAGAKKKVAKLEKEEDLNLAIDRKWFKAQSALLFKIVHMHRLNSVFLHTGSQDIKSEAIRRDYSGWWLLDCSDQIHLPNCSQKLGLNSKITLKNCLR